MKIDLPTGKYVVAVSGGVDSVVLLDLLASSNSEGRPWGLVVAHFDHGIRVDSSEDRFFVEGLARLYDLPFKYEVARLGEQASEAIAREKRYSFLNEVKHETGADAIVTAHHQDDLLETAIINLMRGTGRRGLSALKSTNTIRRPLLGVPKNEIRHYALEHGLEWREDPTNSSDKYLRNRIRHNIAPRLGTNERTKLLSLINRNQQINLELDSALNQLLDFISNEEGISRQQFMELDYSTSMEVMAYWLRNKGIKDYDRKTIERLATAAKTARIGTRFDVRRGYFLVVGRQYLALTNLER